ncbi:unnamed protein product [Gordionus sp. m RMFG-2023]
MTESDSNILDIMNTDGKINASRNNQSLIVQKILNQWLDDKINPLFYSKMQFKVKIEDKDIIEPYYRILDIGCGDGELTKLIHDTILNSKNGLKGTTFGLDTPSEMIAHANEKFAIKIKDANDKGNNNDLCFKVGNISNIHELPKEWFHTFDLVLSFNCMHLMENRIQALSNIVKFLKPDGAFVSVLTGEQTELMINSEINNNQEDIGDGILSKIKQKIGIIYENISTYLYERLINSMPYLPWNSSHILTENLVKTYVEYIKEAGFRNIKVMPIKGKRFICLPSMEHMNKIHMFFSPNLEKIKDLKEKENFTEVYNSFCFELNKITDDNKLNSTPAYYIIGHF